MTKALPRFNWLGGTLLNIFSSCVHSWHMGTPKAQAIEARIMKLWSLEPRSSRSMVFGETPLRLPNCFSVSPRRSRQARTFCPAISPPALPQSLSEAGRSLRNGLRAGLRSGFFFVVLMQAILLPKSRGVNSALAWFVLFAVQNLCFICVNLWHTSPPASLQG
jgi:hypothetical protein